MADYVAASIDKKSFNCPHCDAFASQRWFFGIASPLWYKEGLPNIVDADVELALATAANEGKQLSESALANLPSSGRVRIADERKGVKFNGVPNIHFSRCHACGDVAIWLREKLIFPRKSTAPLPNPDMPEEVKADYQEAASILNDSPRGAAALLRLSIQKLCVNLGGKGKNINDDIAKLVEKGMPEPIQQALDTVRVVGNHSVHPGEIDMKDNREVATKLFGLVNVIVQDRISTPNAIKEMYESVVPEGDRDKIAKRDKRAP